MDRSMQRLKGMIQVSCVCFDANTPSSCPSLLFPGTDGRCLQKESRDAVSWFDAHKEVILGLSDIKPPLNGAYLQKGGPHIMIYMVAFVVIVLFLIYYIMLRGKSDS